MWAPALTLYCTAAKHLLGQALGRALSVNSQVSALSACTHFLLCWLPFHVSESLTLLMRSHLLAAAAYDERASRAFSMCDSGPNWLLYTCAGAQPYKDEALCNSL